ncbi:alpha/beta fold hydrolase [Actinotalea sp. BY-33]|uniref:Proline iminopeptidase n=1 Tax=Actinotalea soli TaxID=2819234 RepID=A0A939RV72_9CELL|nr:alpha/beta fold hydrolase [Actinotalea soli]MBO1751328.1 alpha/beta fold hydrolase [Actinotalea soli]
MHPRAVPHTSGLLDVGGGQSVYWEESGNPRGIPALYVHGGPGGGLGAGGYTMKLDPERFRVLAFEQRGCGRSTPRAGDPAHDLDANTTARLVADMELLRRDRGVEAWVLNGVSWGSTLALAYAQAHPGRTLGLVLMAVTTTRRAEVDWITEGVGTLYPEAWDRLATHAELAAPGYRRGQGRLVEAYAALMRDPDPAVRRAAASAWGAWEDTHVSIGAGGLHRDPSWQDEAWAVPFATLVTHYWAHDGFLEPPVLDRVAEIAHLPAWLIHGRLDVSGPASTPWLLHQRWPASTLVVVEDEGHGGPRMVEAWCEANDTLADRVA